jgi:phytoene synthase
MPVSENVTAVRDSARTGDYERYLAALLGSPAVRDDLLALAAFAGEVCRVPAVVREPRIGAIRLQWWRDAVGSGVATGHPVADAVAAASRRSALPLALLIGYVDAVEARLEPEPAPDVAALRAGIGKTEGALFDLGLRIAGLPAEQAAAIARPAGLALGLGRYLCAGEALPKDLQAMPRSEAVASLATEALSALALAANAFRGTSPSARAVLLPLAVTSHQLRLARRSAGAVPSRLATVRRIGLAHLRRRLPV